MPSEHLVQVAPLGHSPELLTIQRIQTHVDPSQTGLFEGFNLLGQQRSVRRQAEIFEPFDGGQFANQTIETLSYQRLAAG